MMDSRCYALLDDASPPGTPGAGGGGEARSRLYTGHAGTLRCDAIGQWPSVLERMRAALARGQHAVVLCAYELGAALMAPEPEPRPEPETARRRGAQPPSSAPASSAARDAMPASPSVSPVSPSAPTAPLAEILLFDRCARLSAAEVDAWLAARASPADPPAGVAGIHASVTREAFDAALARIHAYIEAGDTYQVNYTYRLRFDAFGPVHALYARLRARQPVPYGALIALEDGRAIVSLSPELFARHENGVLTARPMKGTAPAAPPAQAAENILRATLLAADPKNRAENLMIVDLLRNDIGRIARTGTVEVPALFEVHRYSGVLQMTSTITAELRDDVGLADIFRALYPCGSITGAPKRRTMEIIAELEPEPRGIYTGAIGWFDPGAAGQDRNGKIGDFCLSVPIRTLALSAPEPGSGFDAGPGLARDGGTRRGEMGVGAGIVFDSDAGQEYAECQLKARFLTGLKNEVEIFETMRATPTGIAHRARHLARMAASAAYFGYPWDEAAANAYLDAARAMLARAGDEAGEKVGNEADRKANDKTGDKVQDKAGAGGGTGTSALPGLHRLRLALSPSGAFSVQHAPLAPLGTLDGPVRVLYASDATGSGDLFLRHKTSARARYDAAWRDAEAHGAFDTLFFNERGELTEGGRSNVFVKLGGRWLTPALSCGLLPGVMRAVLLDDPAWNAAEAVITRAMLARAEGIVVCNALRGVLRVELGTGGA